MKVLLLVTLATAWSFATASAVRGADITVIISNIPAAKGQLLVGLFDSQKGFPRKPLPQSEKVTLTSTDPVKVTIKGVSPGRYAIVVIQDLNTNGKLDKSFVGMPQEPIAFSQNPVIPKGVPKFEDCAFDVAGENLEMEIPLKLK